MIKKIKSLEEIERVLKERAHDIPLKKIPNYNKLGGIIEASKKIMEIITANQFITVIGDYDVDGITSSAIMMKFFKDIGYKNYEILIPDRFKEGYGISPKILKRMNPKTSLVITVDNGITGFEAFELLKEKGIFSILTDHHMPKLDENGNMLIPNADIIINPKVSFDYPMKEICGAEVAWYLLAGLKNEGKFEINLVDYLDYLVLAIISDVMPLIDMNRALVKAGLNFLNKGSKPFSRVLTETFKQKIDSTVIAFQIAPRLNATGRLKKAELALNFLIADSYTQANSIFQELNALNENRKEIQEEIKENIEPLEYNRFVFAIGEYHPGVSGIIASKIVEKYKKPAIVFSKKDGLLKGSGRSLGNVDLFELINPLKDLYVTFGGHPGACGISIKEENFEEFARVIDKRSKELFNESDYFIEEHIIGEIDFDLINEEMLEILEKYEPYGFGNPLPLFITKDINVEDTEIIKDKFLKMFLDKNGFLLEGIIFEMPEKEIGNKLDYIKYNIRKNYYGNPSLILKEIKN